MVDSSPNCEYKLGAATMYSEPNTGGDEGGEGGGEANVKWLASGDGGKGGGSSGKGGGAASDSGGGGASHASSGGGGGCHRSDVEDKGVATGNKGRAAIGGCVTGAGRIGGNMGRM